MKIIIRYILTVVLIILVYRETGIWTALTLLLFGISLELIVKILRKGRLL